MKESFRQQMQNEQNIYEAYRQLVTEMSHDIRTPLTSILLYLEILKKGHYQSEKQLEDYLDKIDSKAHHMKLLTDHLFEYTLEGATPKQDEPVRMEQALSDSIADFSEELEANGYTVFRELEWEPCMVQVKTESLKRIFENITSNILKYAEKNAEIRLQTVYSEPYCGLSIMNTCQSQPREVESNKIGVESISTLMQQMDGICTVEQTDIVYEICLLFPKR